MKKGTRLAVVVALGAALLINVTGGYAELTEAAPSPENEIVQEQAQPAETERSEAPAVEKKDTVENEAETAAIAASEGFEQVAHSNETEVIPAEGAPEEITDAPAEEQTPVSSEEEKEEVGRLVEVDGRTHKAPLYERANAESDVLDQLRENETVVVLKKAGKWVNVRTEDGQEGWITDVIEEKAEEQPAEAPAPAEAEEQTSVENSDETPAAEPVPDPDENVKKNEQTEVENEAEVETEAGEQAEPEQTEAEAEEETEEEAEAEAPEAEAGETETEPEEQEASEFDMPVAIDEPLVKDEKDEEAAELPAEGEELLLEDAEIPAEEEQVTTPTVTIFTSARETMNEGETVYLTSDIQGSDGYELRFQWMCDKGNGFEAVEGANEPSYSFKASAETLGYIWRLDLMYRKAV